DLAAAGVAPIAAFYGSPTWAVSSGGPPPPNVHHVPPNTTARGAAGWTAFLTAAVSRYGPGGTYWQGPYLQDHPGAAPLPIHTWQVWNEPNLAAYFSPRVSVPLYADLLRISHAAIVSADPKARISLGGMPCRVKAHGCVQYLGHLYQ